MKARPLPSISLGFLRPGVPRPKPSRLARIIAVAARSVPARLLLLLFLLAFNSLRDAKAQQFDVPLHSLFDPSTGAQPGTYQGAAVAVEGNVAAVGARLAEISESFVGVVKLYNAANGALLHTITNPAPGLSAAFGVAVDISAGLVVIGASSGDGGAQDDGIAYVYDLNSAVPTMPVLTLNNPSPTPGASFGSAVAIYGTRVVVAAVNDDTGATNTGIVYVFDIASGTPTVPAFTLTNPSPAADDRFGWSVAIDGSRVVVGADWDNALAINDGSAYVYDLAGATPAVPIATLNNPMPLSGDTFGRSVAIAGSKVVVGADGADRVFSNSGAVYVYDLSSANPAVPVFTLANPHASSSSYFGSDVDISGTRVLVGAYYDNSSGVRAGIAYVFNLASPNPYVPIVTIPNPSPAESDYFGEAVGISGSRFVIGAYGDDTLGEFTGNAYFYDLASATPSVPVAGPSDYIPASRDYFGASVAISGTRTVIGADGDDTGVRDTGRAYVFDFASAAPTVPLLTLNNPSPGYGDRFGNAVAISGMRVVIGAYWDDAAAVDAGSAYVYDLTRPNPSVPLLALISPGLLEGDAFGCAVAIDGTRIVVGAVADDTGAVDSGIAYVYDLTQPLLGEPWITLTNPSPAARDNFGNSVAISGARVLVGAWRDNGRAADEGSVFVFDLNSPTPGIPIFTLTNPAPATGDRFGAAVAIDGTRAVVGAYLDDAVAADDGTVFVYDLAGATPAVPVLTLTNPNADVAGYFGRAISVSDTRVVVGASGDNTGAGAAGITYVYDLASALPAAPVLILTNPSPAFRDNFGYSVAISGTTIVAGAPSDDTHGVDRGAVYVYGVQPKLHIAPSASGLVTLSWKPSVSPGFVLQHAERLGPSNWSNAPSGPANPITIPATNMSRFYRLFHP